VEYERPCDPARQGDEVSTRNEELDRIEKLIGEGELDEALLALIQYLREEAREP
jgi:hypothetical protein